MSLSFRNAWAELLSGRSARRLGDDYRVQPTQEGGGGVTAESGALWLGGAGCCEVVSPAERELPAGVLLIPRAGAPPLGAAAALLSSRYLAALIWPGGARLLKNAPLRELTLPHIPSHFALQLELLWRRRAGASKNSAISRSIQESCDRVCAEIYRLSLDELMRFERELSLPKK